MPEVEGDGFACAGEDGVARRGEEPRFLEWGLFGFLSSGN